MKGCAPGVGSDKAKQIRKAKKGETVDLEQDFIVLAVPSDSVEIDITAKVYIGGLLKKVTCHLDFPEVRAAIKEAYEGGYLPSNALFTLAPTKAEKLAALIEKAAADPEDDE